MLDRIKAELCEAPVIPSCGAKTGPSEHPFSLGSSSPTSSYLWNPSAGVR